MAIAFTAAKDDNDQLYPALVSGRKVAVGEITIGASYSTGGEDIAASDINSDASSIYHISIGLSEDGSVLYEWDETNDKILAFDYTDASSSEVSAATDLTATGKEAQVTFVYA